MGEARSRAEVNQREHRKTVQKTDEAKSWSGKTNNTLGVLLRSRKRRHGTEIRDECRTTMAAYTETPMIPREHREQSYMNKLDN